MLDNDLAQTALRLRALGLSVCTTGSTSLSATALGFARGSGSFIADGFAPGMEVFGTGYNTNNNAPRMITEVRAQFMAADGCTVQGASSGRTLSVGLPAVARRAWELLDFTPTVGWPYITEEYVGPATSTRRTTASNGGKLEETGIYFLTWYGLSNHGPTAIRRCVDALKKLYTSGTVFTAGSDSLAVRGDVGPSIGRVTPQKDGFSSCVLTIPWRCFSQNVVAA